MVDLDRGNSVSQSWGDGRRRVTQKGNRYRDAKQVFLRPVLCVTVRAHATAHAEPTRVGAGHFPAVRTLKRLNKYGRQR